MNDVCALQRIDTSPREDRAPAEPAVTYAVLWDRDAATETLNDRRLELGLSLIELDEAAGQAAGTAGKYLGPSQTKSLGIESFFKLAGALGLRITVEVDPKATAAVIKRSRPRNARQARPENFSQKCNQRTLDRAWRYMASEYTWNEILAAASEARATVAAEQTAKAERKAVAEVKHKARPASAAAAYDAPMLTASEALRI